MKTVTDAWYCFEEQHKWMKEFRENKTTEDVSKRQEIEQRKELISNTKPKPVEVMIIS